MHGLLASVVAMKILVTNDDGIDAQGIGHLERIAREFGEVVVVAPKHHQSGCSHQITFEGHLEAQGVDGDRHWIDGFPADCVRIGLAHFCPDADLVLAGINHGANLGLDNFLSGTVAAAREAAFFDLPAIAISQYHRGLSDCVWEQAEQMARRAVLHLLDGKLQSGHYWNVNLPCLTPEVDTQDVTMVECPLDRSPLPADYSKNENGFSYEGIYHQREHKPGTDVSLCKAGNVTMTLIGLGV